MKSRLIILLATFALMPIIALAGGGEGFVPLVGIPGLQSTGDFNGYINALYALAISIAALIAVVKIVLAGAKYMMDDIVTHKSEAKEDIKNALIGLLIIIGAVVILTTVNSDLTNLQISAPKVELDNSVPAAEYISAFESLCAEADDRNSSCDVESCDNLREQRQLFGVELNRTLVMCSEICSKIPNSLFSNETETCGFIKADYDSAASEYTDSLLASHCPVGESCIVQFCSEDENNFCVAGDDITTITEEGSCTNMRGVYVQGACIQIGATTNESGTILRVDPDTDYVYHDPSVVIDGETIPAAENHGQPVTFASPLQLDEDGAMVRVTTTGGDEGWVGCGIIRPSPCFD